MRNKIILDRVNRLKVNTLDLDFLDEKIRENTGYLDDEELLVLFD